MNIAPIFALGAALALPLASSPAWADTAKSALISVSATGSATATPDIARMNLSVQREAKTARAALDANNTAMTEILKSLRNSGIQERDLQTSNFNIQPRYHFPTSSSSSPKLRKLVGYVVTNSLTVRVRDLMKLGAILDKAVSLGVNSGGGIAFSTENPAPIIEQARTNAMAKAISKAKTLTEAAGVKLGRIVEISETNRQPPRPRAMARMQGTAIRKVAVPVASGENSYSVSITVKWELDQ